MEKTKVIFRKESDGNIIAFLPETPATYGNIECLSKIDGHGEACFMYYRNNTKPVKEEEYKYFLQWMESAYGYSVLPCKRLNMKELQKIWRLS